MMHPDDANSRKIKEGNLVNVKSVKGVVSLPVEITGQIMPGVVSIPHGHGHNAPGSKINIARAHAGVSINDITDDQFLDALSGNAAFSGVKVEVEKSG